MSKPHKYQLNILIALPYIDKPTLDYLGSISNHTRFLLDSGAFTAWKKGREIKLDDYCKIVENLPTKPWRYFTLDQIGDPIKTKNNYVELLKRGFKPIPVFTRGEKLTELEWMYSTSDVVGLGGLVGTQGNKGFVKGLMKAIGNRKTHWLGFTNHDFVSAFKPYSCDSSSWSAPLRFGGKLPIYTGRGRWKTVQKNSFSTHPDPWVTKEIINMGEDPREMALEKNWHNSGSGRNVLERILYKGWVRYSLDLEKALNIRMFLAVASAAKRYTMSLNSAFEFWMQHDLFKEKSK